MYSFNVPGEIRTPDRRLRRALLYPAELLGQKRAMRIELTSSAWKAEVLPLNYARMSYYRSLHFVTDDAYKYILNNEICQR